MQTDLWSHWKQPLISSQTYVTGLKVNNSLRPGQLVPFIPAKGREVKFYYCGPTVYSYSHLGHARTYIGLDILKRLLRDYFKYDLITVMNITDVDDKIIAASKEQQVDFLQVTKIWEKDFFDQMDKLGVELPDVITRVSEYVPDIVKFVEKIIQNGYAYQSNGSVYFDVNKYTSDGYPYCKLEPTNRNNITLLKEGEGATQEGKDTEKKSQQDFALWKASKPGEPKWSSPWGDGRPGWHIECSVMAHDMLGSPIDLHAGGVDLRFPHHDNSIAQTESYLQCNQWINYFVHTGHLNIKDQKMSKSKKNFLTIGEVLNRYSARQIRLNFALHLYDATMNYSEESMQEAIQKDLGFSAFFMSINAAIRDANLETAQRWNEQELNLNQKLLDVKVNVHEHLCNNFNVPNALKEIETLINQTNVYLKAQPKKALLINLLRYINQFMELLGLQYNRQDEQQQYQITPFMNVLAKFRDQIRKQAKDKDFKAIFETCDILRDDDLLLLGIKLEDKAIGEPSIWKQSTVQELMQEREIKLQLRQKLLDEKIQKEKAAQLKEEQRQAQMRIPPNEIFIKATELYSQFDQSGIPTHDAKGEPLSKKQQKIVKQKWDEQKKLHEEYLQQQNK